MSACFKVDWITLLFLSSVITVVANLWVFDRRPMKFSAWLHKKSHWWYAFCFCYPCVIFKLSAVAATYVRPVMFLDIAPYPVWTAAELVFNFIAFYFSSICISGLIFGQAMKNIYYESTRFYKLFTDTIKGGKGEKG